MPPTNPDIEVALVDHPVDYARIEPFPADAGGECVFLGRTRAESHPDHGNLERLSYDAYRPMAERVLHRLAEQAVRRHGARTVRLRHATGAVPVGAASVLVQVVAGHRDAAFAACRFLIDALKREAPIWKREEWSDGTTWAARTPVAPPGDPGNAPQGDVP